MSLLEASDLPRENLIYSGEASVSRSRIIVKPGSGAMGCTRLLYGPR